MINGRNTNTSMKRNITAQFLQLNDDGRTENLGKVQAKFRHSPVLVNQIRSR